MEFDKGQKKLYKTRQNWGELAKTNQNEIELTRTGQ